MATLLRRFLDSDLVFAFVLLGLTYGAVALFAAVVWLTLTALLAGG